MLQPTNNLFWIVDIGKDSVLHERPYTCAPPTHVLSWTRTRTVAGGPRRAPDVTVAGGPRRAPDVTPFMPHPISRPMSTGTNETPYLHTHMRARTQERER